MSAAKVDVLAVKDLRLLRDAHYANSTYGAPFLPSPGYQKRARALVGAGFLKDEAVQLTPNLEGWVGVTITDAGVNAYNAALAKVQP